MATLDVTGDRVRVRFSRWERLAGLVGDLDVPRAAVTSASPLAVPMRATRGWRVGTGLPGVLLLGTWRRHGRRQLVALRRDRPAVRLVLAGERYDEVLVSVPDPDLVVAALAPARV